MRTTTPGSTQEMNDTRINQIMACLDDARTSLHEATTVARALEVELPPGHAYSLVLKMIQREAGMSAGFCNDHLRTLNQLNEQVAS